VCIATLFIQVTSCLVNASEVTQAQAANEFNCADASVLSSHSEDGIRQGAVTVDVNACGHPARYLCVLSNGYTCRRLAEIPNIPQSGDIADATADE